MQLAPAPHGCLPSANHFARCRPRGSDLGVGEAVVEPAFASASAPGRLPSAVGD